MPKLLVKIPKQKRLLIGPRSRKIAPAAPVAPHVVKKDAELELIGKAVFFMRDGVRVAGKVAAVAGSELVVHLAVPSREGLLLVSDSEVKVAATDLEVTKALMQQKRMSAFESGVAIDVAKDSKAVPVMGGAEGKTIVDYRDVVIEGFASTWGAHDKRDRGGDYIARNAFDKTIREFMTNPVILRDHRNDTNSLAGSWEKVGLNPDGLAVRGLISNAPGLVDTRFKLVERHLKGLSIGGIWYYSSDEPGLIEEAELYEISLVAVPMNPEALAYTRSLGIADCTKAFTRFWKQHSALRED